MQQEAHGGAQSSTIFTLIKGPPGTGKTLLAKTVASHADISFLGVSVSNLMRPEIGGSEQAVARAFKQAKRHSRRIFLELYAGHGLIAQCMKKRGFAVIAFEIKHGHESHQ